MPEQNEPTITQVAHNGFVYSIYECEFPEEPGTTYFYLGAYWLGYTYNQHRRPKPWFVATSTQRYEVVEEFEQAIHFLLDKCHPLVLDEYEKHAA